MSVVTSRGFHLGKLAPKPFESLKFLSGYLGSEAPAPPPQAHYGSRVKVPWGMCANGPDPSVTLPGTPQDWSGCGDCVVGMCAHSLLCSNYDENGHVLPVPTSNIDVETYCTLAGCTPEQLFSDPNQYDTGLNISTTLQTWHTTGLFGTKIDAWAPVDISNVTEMRQGLAFFGGLLIGVQLPESSEQQFPNEWTVVPGSPIIGGHAIFLTGYASNRWYGCTWGQLLIGGISTEWLSEFCDEAYVVISEQAVNAGEGPDPNYGATYLNLAALNADLAALNA